MEVKIITFRDKDIFENTITEFYSFHTVVGIKFSTAIDKDGKLHYSAMILFQE